MSPKRPSDQELDDHLVDDGKPHRSWFVVLTGCIVLLTTLAISHWHGPKWRGYVYVDRDAQTVPHFVGKYTSFDQCRSAAQAVIRRLPKPWQSGYECGLRCRHPRGQPDDPLFCETTAS